MKRGNVSKMILALFLPLTLLLACCQRPEAPPPTPLPSPPPASPLPASPPPPLMPAFPGVPVSEFYLYDPSDKRPVVDEKIEIKPDLDLVIRKFGFVKIFFVQVGMMGRMLAAVVNDAEVDSVTPDVIRLRCYGYSDDGWRGFPYQIVYDVSADERVEAPLYLDCAEPFRFNFYRKVDAREPVSLRGHGVVDLEADADTVTVWFSPSPDEHWGVKVPEMAAAFDESSCTLSFLFVGSKASHDAMAKAEGLRPTTACKGFALVQTTEGARLCMTLTQPMLYRVDYTTGGLLSMTVWFKSR